jgi:D-tagatose-1,6-bisphosphate aldolase subunit GatZ/KbaZ
MKAQKKGQARGIYSICSANRYVLEASMLQAKRDGSAVCIESTSNQVNQFGGYMGMTAAQFVAYVHSIAAEIGFPVEKIILGGDHLGPNAWQKEPAKVAMEKAAELVRSCVLAGYSKIHLDASMRCADDPGGAHDPLAEETVTERAADLCAAAEAAYATLPSSAPAPVYVIGTEVPVPGGEKADHAGLLVTRAADTERTLSISREAFKKRKLEKAWERVIAVVVQPGVEFGDSTVFPYDRAKAKALSKMIEKHQNVVFEAHSTDYQSPQALKELVEDHFAILKVGPWLTFAFREAVFALAEIERELLDGKKQLSRIRETLEEVMLENPGYWKPYYSGDASELKFARKYSFSDRSRYYWPNPKVDAALKMLLKNLSEAKVPVTLLSQYMPVQCAAVRSGELPSTPRDLIHHRVMEVTDIYARACR